MPRKSPRRPVVAAALMALAVLAAACGGADDDGPSGGAAAGGTADSTPTIVVTTDILGDVVGNVVGDLAVVETLMPTGTSPHELQASARQAADMRSADALVVSGGGFEAAMVDAIEAATADGVPTFAAIDAVAPLEPGHARTDGHEHDDDGSADHEAAPGDHEAPPGDADEHDDGHEHGPVDPHFFTDPSRMAAAARGIGEFLAAEVPGIDATALGEQTATYVARLEELDAEVQGILAPVPPARRKLVTNHEVFGYFADRYDFEVVGAVIPGVSTQAESNAADLAALVQLVREEGVAAVFADTSSPDRLARALAGEVGDVEVVELFSESLGGPGSGAETYVDLVRTNAQRIADALAA